MKTNFTNSIGRLFALLLITVLIGGFANAQVQKRVLVEEFTGEWCGYCPDGAQVLHDIVTKNQGKVLAAAFHNGTNEWLAIPENTELTGALGCIGYPSAYIDRMVWNVGGQNVISLGRGSWDQATTAALTVPADVDVKLLYQWNAGSRLLKMDISGTFQKDLNANLRFNVYIVENNIAAHSQTNGGANYVHQHVLRKLMGGIWGTAGIIPQVVKNGDKYTYSYSFTVPSEWVWSEIQLIGVVQKYHTNNGDRQILNCVAGIEGQADMEFTCTAGPQTSALGAGQTAQRDYEIKNLTNVQKTYNINVTKTSRTPSNWNASVQLPTGATKTTSDNIQTEELIIGPNAKKTVTLKLTTGDIIGMGDAEISVKEKNNASATEGKGSLTVASAEIDKFQVLDDDESGTNSLATTITNSGNTGYYDINASEFLPIYNQFNKLNTIVWTCGEEGVVSDQEASTIKSIIDGGTPLLLSGATIVNSLDAALPNLLFTAGCSYQAVCRQGQGAGNINLIGYVNDPITNGFDRAMTLKKYLTFGIEINNPKTFPILRHKFVDTIVAIRSELPNARVVFLGINPTIITNTTARNNLINDALKWLNGTGPKIASSVSEVQFGDVTTDGQKDMTFDINNTGEEALTVSEMTVDWEYSNVFSVVSPATPFTVQPGASQEVTVRFEPQITFGYDVSLTIKSNAVNDDEIVVLLKGTGINPGNGPMIETDLQTVDYGNVPINDPKDERIEVTNTGDNALTITALNITSDFYGIFEVVSPSALPLTIGPDLKTYITVKFKPVQKVAYTGTLEIVSNAVNNNKFTVEMSGVGDNPIGVKDDEGNEISIAAGPNPFSAKTTIKYTVTNNGGLVNLSVIDARGTEVAQLVSKNLAAGDYTQEFEAKGLSSGVYYVIARINGKAMQMPIVLEK